MTMATIDYPYHDVNRNPKSPDRKLPVQTMVYETPDRATIGTIGTDSLIDSPPNNGDLGLEIDGMITVVKTYVQAPQGYSPTRKEFETTMEAIEAKAEEEEAIKRQQELEHAAQIQAERASQEANFMDSIFGAFSLSSGSTPEPSQPVPHSSASTASQRGTVVHEMLKRLVLQELQSRRDKSATTIQAAVRRVLAQKKKLELRVIAAERKRALSELAALQKYDDRYSNSKGAATSTSTTTKGKGNRANQDDNEEVAEEIRTSKFSKMKTRLKTLRKKKKKKRKSRAKAPLLPLPSVPEDCESVPPLEGDDLPVQERSGKKSKWKKMAKKMKVKTLVSKMNNKKNKQSSSSNQPRSTKSRVRYGVVVQDGNKKVPEPPVYEPPRKMGVIITTTDDSIPTPEAEAEAEAYRLQQQQKRQQARQRGGGFGEEESTRRSHASLPSSLPSGRDFRWSNFVLADDATSITSARTRPLLDSWFRSFVFDRETLEKLDDDAIEEMVEMAFTNNQLQKDLSLVPEMDWTTDDWKEAQTSLFRCSEDHYEEITYQTKRFVSNEVTL